MTRSKYAWWEEDWEAIASYNRGEEKLASFRNHTRIVQRITESAGNYKKWEGYCKTAQIPPAHLYDTMIGNPPQTQTHRFKDVKVTVNSLRFGYYIHRIAEKYKGVDPIKVLEVGAGYGGLAEQLSRRFEIEHYYLIDGEPMLNLQRYYLNEAGLGDRITLFNSDLPTFTMPKVDIIISTNSLCEMRLPDVTKYIELFEAKLKYETGLLYLVQRKIDKSPHLHTAWASYPFSTGWKLDDKKPFILHSSSDKYVECFGRLFKK